MGILKPRLSISLLCKFIMSKNYVNFFKSRTYLTDVTAAYLRRHLCDMNGILKRTLPVAF